MSSNYRLKFLGAQGIMIKSSHNWVKSPLAESSTDDYAEDGGPGVVDFYVVFTVSLCALLLWKKFNNYVIWNQIGFKLKA